MYLRAGVSVALILPSAPKAYGYDENRPYAFSLPSRINEFQPDYNRLNLNPVIKLQAFNIPSFIAPDLDINNLTMRFPQIQVRDIGDSVWVYEREGSHFNSDLRLYDQYQANTHFNGATFEAPKTVAMDMGKMKFETGSLTPTSFSQTFRDEKGNFLKIDRTNQTAQPNPSFKSFKNFYEQKDRSSQPRLVPGTSSHPPPPTQELISGYEERSTASVLDSNGDRQKSTTFLKIDSLDNDSNLHRFISNYRGTVREGDQKLSFTVSSSHDFQGNIKSLQFEITAPGAPVAQISWKPVQGANPGQAFALLRDNLPVPVLVGPRGNFRFNGVDVAQSPLKVTSDGNISPKQVGDVKDLANLVDQEKLGINVSFSPPKDPAKARFSIGNVVRNLWYMVTGRWSEAKNLRQDLSSMQKNDPGRFVLAAGFKDISFMGIRDLRNALSNSKDINLPQTKVQKIAEAVPHLEFKTFTDPKGRTLTFAAPIALNEGRDGTFHLREPLKLPPESIPVQFGAKEPAELTKATFKLVNESLTLTEGVVKVGQEKFYLDPRGDFTNVNVFDQGLQKIETAKNHLEPYSDRLTNKLSVSIDVTNNYLQNLHGVTGQILTAKVEMTDTLMTHRKQVDAFAGETDQLRASFENEDYGVLQKNLPGLHDQQMSLMKQEQTLGSQVQALGGFAEKLGNLTKEAKTLIPKINSDHMLTERVTEQGLQFNSETYFFDDKKILSGRANDVQDSIAGLAEAGLISRDTAKDWAQGIITARDKFMISVPRMGYEISRTIEVIKDPGTSFAYAVNRKADAMFFDRWDRMIEKDPQGMVAFSEKGLLWSKIALGGSLVAGAVQAPFAMAVGFGSGLATEKALVSIGVKKANARFYGGIVGLIAGAKLTSPQFVNKALNFSRNAWGKIGSVIENAEFGLPGMSRSIGRLTNSERGSVLIEIPTTKRGLAAQPTELLFTKKIQTISTPYGVANQSTAPEALAARAKVNKGATLYRIGTAGKSESAEAQFWSLEHPLNPTYGKNYGVPSRNLTNADFIEMAVLKPGTPFITRPAPGYGSNPGGAIEVVVPKSGVNLRSFSTRGDRWQ